jgi:hypothetical protein
MTMNTTMNNGQTKYYSIGLAAILVAAFMIVQPMNAYSQVGASGILFNNCTLATQPDDPIDMNTVIGYKSAQTTAEYAKTIHREKQIFNCEDLNNPDQSYIVEVAIFAEIIENMDTRSIIRKQAEVVTCVKDQDGFVLECQRRTPTTQSISVSNCEEQFLANPEEMTTVVDPDSPYYIKTIDAQKEIFLCDFNKKVDVVIFIELWEDLGKLPGNPVVKREVVALRCTTSTLLAIVESCIYSSVPLVVPP